MNKQIIEEAADWFVEFSTGEADPSTKNAFDRWLRKSPEHGRVYLEMLPIWDDGAIPLPEDKTTAAELIALARGQENVFALSPAHHSVKERAASSRSVGMRRFAMAASIASILILGASAAWFTAQRSPTYSTDLGRQRSVRLSDGSMVELNTKSRIRVRFTPQARDVELLEGQALFTVAKDPQRPFTVSSDSTRVRAVGTAFDVYRKAGGTVVTVVEGRVSINPLATTFDADRKVFEARSARHGKPPVLLSAGEQITLSAAAPATPRRADVAIATAWTQGRLIFDSMPLPDVAGEFNRYNIRRIVVDDATLRDFRVNGSFRSSDPASLLRFLKEQPGITISEAGKEIHIARE